MLLECSLVKVGDTGPLHRDRSLGYDSSGNIPKSATVNKRTRHVKRIMKHYCICLKIV
jgi:hypothetical protein